MIQIMIVLMIFKLSQIERNKFISICILILNVITLFIISINKIIFIFSYLFLKKHVILIHLHFLLLQLEHLVILYSSFIKLDVKHLQ